MVGSRGPFPQDNLPLRRKAVGHEKRAKDGLVHGAEEQGREPPRDAGLVVVEVVEDGPDEQPHETRLDRLHEDHVPRSKRCPERAHEQRAELLEPAHAPDQGDLGFQRDEIVGEMVLGFRKMGLGDSVLLLDAGERLAREGCFFLVVGVLGTENVEDKIRRVGVGGDRVPSGGKCL